jgi:hypothetical protein
VMLLTSSQFVKKARQRRVFGIMKWVMKDVGSAKRQA